MLRAVQVPRALSAAVALPSSYKQFLCKRVCVMASSDVFAGPGSEELRKRGCGICNKDTPKVPKEEMPKLLAAIPAWNLVDEDSAISRKFVARNFKAAIDFINKAAEVAEAESHHPDLHITNYREVEVKVTTHATGGLTNYDFILAAKLDEIPVDYSPKWLEKAQAALAGAIESTLQARVDR